MPTHVHGREPIGVNQPPGLGDDFPFVAPSADISRLLGDFYLSYPDNVCSFVYPLRVSWMYGFGDNVVAAPPGYPTPSHTRDLLVVDANNEVIFDSTTADTYQETAWGDRLLIVQWMSSTHVCRCTLHTAWSPEDVALAYDQYIVPESGVLDARTYARLPARITSIRIGNDVLTGHIKLQNGFNTVLTPAPGTRKDGTRFVDKIVFNAAPGSGDGRQPGCDEVEPLLRNINQIKPDDNGTFILEADGCFRAQLPLSVSGSPGARAGVPAYTGMTSAQATATIALAMDCQPCCLCADYVNTYRGLRRLWTRWSEAAASLESVRDQYAENVTRWNNQRTYRANQSAKIIGESGDFCSASVGAMWCNYSDCVVHSVELRLTYVLYAGSGRAPYNWGGRTFTYASARFANSNNNGQFLKYAPRQTGPSFGFFADYAAARDSTALKITTCMSECVEGETFDVYLTVHAPDLAEPSACVLPVIPYESLPVDLKDVWTESAVALGDTVRAIAKVSIPLSPVSAETCACC